MFWKLASRVGKLEQEIYDLNRLGAFEGSIRLAGIMPKDRFDGSALTVKGAVEFALGKIIEKYGPSKIRIVLPTNAYENILENSRDLVDVDLLEIRKDKSLRGNLAVFTYGNHTGALELYA